MGDSIDVKVIKSWIQRSYWDRAWSSYLENVLTGNSPETDKYEELKEIYDKHLEKKLEEIEAEKHFRHLRGDFNDHLRTRTVRRTVLVCSASYGSKLEHVGTIEITVPQNNPETLRTGWFRECSVVREPGDYTDDVMMRAVEQLISNDRPDKWTLKVFITTSPPYWSADRIVEFCKKYNVDMTIICSSLYMIDRKEMKDGLRRLNNSTSNITLRIFTTQDWNDLDEACKELEGEVMETGEQKEEEEEEEEIQLLQQQTACLMGDSIDVKVIESWIQRSYWDRVWSSYLENVLNGSPPETEKYMELKAIYDKHLEKKLEKIEAEKHLKHFHPDFNNRLRINTESRTVLVCTGPVGTIEIHSLYGVKKSIGLFKNISEPYDYTQGGKNSKNHTELLLKRTVEELRSNDKKTDKWTLKVFITTSPCWECADDIVEFCKKYNVDMTIICSSLYKIHEKEMKEGLRRLTNSTSNITLRIFTTQDWNDLDETYKKLNEIWKIEQQQQQQQQKLQQQTGEALVSNDTGKEGPSKTHQRTGSKHGDGNSPKKRKMETGSEDVIVIDDSD